MIIFRRHRFAFMLMSLSTIFVALVPLFLVASCRPLQQSPAELKARETLRSMTRGGVLPAEDAVAKIEKDFPNTTAGALARMVHARIRLKANDFAGAAALLDGKPMHDYTVVGDYALWMRGNTLEYMTRVAEARAAYEQLATQYPYSLRARDSILRIAQMSLSDGQAAAVPAILAKLAAKDDGAALLLTGKMQEQTGNPTGALASYRRLYFYAPTAIEVSEAAAALVRLKASTVSANAAEGIARAEKLYAARRYSEAYDAYTDALSRFANSATPELQARRAIAAANARRYPEAGAALASLPTSSEGRAEAMFNLALAYGRAKQWAQARTNADELRRTNPNSPWTMRAFVQLGQRAEDAKDDLNASYYYRAAVSSFTGNAEVTPAQFYLAWATHDSKNLAEASRLLTEHLALYAGNNSDFRGKAAYWAARDSERTGKLAEARAIYQGLLARYDANWYGYLAKQRLDDMARNGNMPQGNFSADSLVGRAVANLQTVTVAEEPRWPSNDEGRAESDPRDWPAYFISKADQLAIIGNDDWALAELAALSAKIPTVRA